MPLTLGVDDGDDRFGCSAWRHYSDAVAVDESALGRVGLADLQGTFASPSLRRAWRLRFLGIVTRPSDLSVTTPQSYPSSRCPGQEHWPTLPPGPASANIEIILATGPEAVFGGVGPCERTGFSQRSITRTRARVTLKPMRRRRRLNSRRLTFEKKGSFADEDSLFHSPMIAYTTSKESRLSAGSSPRSWRTAARIPCPHGSHGRPGSTDDTAAAGRCKHPPKALLDPVRIPGQVVV